MERSQDNFHDFSHNDLRVFGGNVQAQYGNNYYVPPTPEISWGDITRWIFGTGPILSQEDFQRSMQRRRVEGSTCSWFLEGEAFGKWINEPSSFLWLRGKTGCGKTMLCSSAIKKLQGLLPASPNQALIYHFFTLTDHQSRTSNAVTRNLVYQLANHDDETRASTIAVFKKKCQGTQVADYDQLLSVFKDLLKIPSAIFIIIDAINEGVDQAEILFFLEDLWKDRSTQTRVLVSSNATQSAESDLALEKLKTEKVSVNSKAVNGDIEAHIRKLELYKYRWDHGQRDKIVNSITRRSDGSFRWAVGQLTNIQPCNTEEELDKALSSLPQDLTQTYERILSAITIPEDVKNLRTILCWLLHARRPLRIEELREAVGVSTVEEPHFDPRRRLNKRPTIFEQCNFLIVADQDLDAEDIFAVDVDNFPPSDGPLWQEGSVLRLDHSSVIQFLEHADELSVNARKFAVTNSEGHVLIAQSCLAYILYSDSSAAPPNAADSCPLFDYAIHYWYYHVQQSGIHDERLAILIEEALRTSWETYRLVTYPNISTRYNPWLGTHAPMSGPGNDDEQGINLCAICRSISYEEIKKQRGMEHRTYATLAASAHECSLCEMIHCALLQFGVARHCQIYPKTSLSSKTSESTAMEVDTEIHRTVGNSKITLRMETQDPFLLISCYCYFGRLHLYTNPESPIASNIFGRAVHSNPQSLLANCQHWLRQCQENHGKCHRNNNALSSCLPTRLIEIGEECVHLKVLPRKSLGLVKFATLTWTDGASAPLPKLSTENLGLLLEGGPLRQLPRLFQDVVHVTRSLGIHYLWIDFLCIDHSDQEDWDHEKSQVQEYFANAEVNIVAGVKDGQTEVLRPRLPPRFQPTRLNGTEDVFVGWLGTDAYSDPHGLRVSQYPDAWKYESPAHLRPWATQEMGLSRRNLVFQGDEHSSQDFETVSTMLTSQVYMQCREEIRWENGRRRSGIAESLSDWYNLVEDYSGRSLSKPREKMSDFSKIAHKYSRRSEHSCGKFLVGLWSNDLIRGLLWRPVVGSHSRAGLWIAPSWSWGSVPGQVKHIWPRDAKSLASIRWCEVNRLLHSVDGYIVVRGLLVEIRPVDKMWNIDPQDIKVNVLVENEHKEALWIRSALDTLKTSFFPYLEIGRGSDLYGIRMTRRVGLLLMDSGHGNMERVGWFVVAKPDTPRWMAIMGERDVKII